jgi:hypothetical protein
MEEYSAERKARIHIDEMLEKSGLQIIRRGMLLLTKATLQWKKLKPLPVQWNYGLYRDDVLVGELEATSEKTGVAGILRHVERYS